MKESTNVSDHTKDANRPSPQQGHSHSHSHGGFANVEEFAQKFDDPTRDAWQRPDDVLRAMNLSPAMIVADVGAGTGYFAMRLARAVPQGEVYATDAEPAMVGYLEARAQRENIQNLRAVCATEASTGLAPHSVDRILVVHVWHHLEHRVAYARTLATALRAGGKLFIVDFTLAAHQGPPLEMRLSPEVLIAELQAAGRYGEPCLGPFGQHGMAERRSRRSGATSELGSAAGTTDGRRGAARCWARRTFATRCKQQRAGDRDCRRTMH